ncbi:MAG: DUF1178 family protein [Pseudomonadota bacterium]
MIRFSLLCPEQHEFEGWFPDNARFEQQAEQQLLSCPFCGATDIRKAIMAPAVLSGRKSRQVEHPAPAPPTGQSQIGDQPAPVAGSATGPAPPANPAPDPQKVMVAYAMMRRVQTFIEKNFDNVGRKFPEEVRKIHHGEVEVRNVYGEASPEEAKELQEEGIDVQAMPLLPKLDG